MSNYTKYTTNLYARIVASALEPGHIKVFVSRYASSYRVQGPVPHSELLMLGDAIEKIRPRCVPAHEQSGIKFLLNKLLTPKGNLRQTEHAKEFDANVGLFLQSHGRGRELQIHLTGLRWLNGTGVYNDRLAPVYRVSSPSLLRTRGSIKAFEYVATSWQSGGHFEITNRERVE